MGGGEGVKSNTHQLNKTAENRLSFPTTFDIETTKALTAWECGLCRAMQVLQVNFYIAGLQGAAFLRETAYTGVTRITKECLHMPL